MNPQRLILSLGHTLVSSLQVTLFVTGLVWYPKLVAALLAQRVEGAVDPSSGLVWNLLTTLVVIAPVALLIVPHRLLAMLGPRLRAIRPPAPVETLA